MGHVSQRMMQLALAGLALCAALGLWMGFDDARPRADSVRQRLSDTSVVSGPEPTAAVAMSDDAVARASQAIVEDAPAASDAATPAAAVAAAPAAPPPRKAPRPAAVADEPPRPQPAPAPAQDPVGDLIPPAPAEDPPF